MAETPSQASFQSPAQRYLTKSQSDRPATEARADDRRELGNPMPEKTKLQLDEEELEVPAFMRKPLSK